MEADSKQLFKINGYTAYFSILCGGKVASFILGNLCYASNTHYKTAYCIHTHFKQ